METKSTRAKTELAYELDRLGMSPETFARYARLSLRQSRRHYAGVVQNPHIRTRRNIKDALADLEKQMKDATRDGRKPEWL
jgi:hypothetical protein